MPESKRLSYAELMAADPDTLSTDEMNRRLALTNLKKAEREMELVETQNQKFQDEKIDRKRIADTKSTIIEEEKNRIAREQSICKHKTGGKGLPGFYNGDGKQGYAVATQELPTGEVYFICFRCQTEWHHPKWMQFNHKGKNISGQRAVMEGIMSLDEYKRREAKYFEVKAWDKPLFETDSGVTPGSVKFHLPKLIEQQVRDDEDFQGYLAAREKLAV